MRSSQDHWWKLLLIIIQRWVQMILRFACVSTERMTAVNAYTPEIWLVLPDCIHICQTCENSGLSSKKYAMSAESERLIWYGCISALKSPPFFIARDTVCVISTLMLSAIDLNISMDVLWVPVQILYTELPTEAALGKQTGFSAFGRHYDRHCTYHHSSFIEEYLPMCHGLHCNMQTVFVKRHNSEAQSYSFLTWVTEAQWLYQCFVLNLASGHTATAAVSYSLARLSVRSPVSSLVTPAVFSNCTGPARNMVERLCCLYRPQCRVSDLLLFPVNYSLNSGLQGRESIDVMFISRMVAKSVIYEASSACESNKALVRSWLKQL